MKLTNLILVTLGAVCLYVASHCKLGWEQALINLTYSYITGVSVYLFAVAIPAWTERRRLRKIVQSRIEEIGVMLTNLLVGFPKEGNYSVPDIGDSERCLAQMLSADWNSYNSVPLYPQESSKLYQTFYCDYRDIQSSIHDFIMCYRQVLSVRQLQLLEDMRNAGFMSLLEVSVIYNSTSIAKPVADEVSRGFCGALNIYAELKKVSGL